jgi:hypothetical protein
MFIVLEQSVASTLYEQERALISRGRWSLLRRKDSKKDRESKGGGAFIHEGESLNEKAYKNMKQMNNPSYLSISSHPTHCPGKENAVDSKFHVCKFHLW